MLFRGIPSKCRTFFNSVDVLNFRRENIVLIILEFKKKVLLKESAFRNADKMTNNTDSCETALLL